MFRASISPIFRNNILCVTTCGIKHPSCCWVVTWKQGNESPSASRLTACNNLSAYTTSCNTQSSAPEDGRDWRQNHVELIGIINKLLLLHLVGYIIYINDARSKKHQTNEIQCIISNSFTKQKFLSTLKDTS